MDEEDIIKVIALSLKDTVIYLLLISKTKLVELEYELYILLSYTCILFI